MARNLSGIGLRMLSFACIGALGVGIGAVLFRPGVPDSISPEQTQLSAGIGTRDYDDSQSVTLSVSQQPQISIVLPLGGKITGFTCAAGQNLESGKTLIEIDGTPIVGLATSTPLWRTLNLGDTGKDVDALQNELKNLGKLQNITGKIDHATLNSMATMLGVPSKDLSNIPVERLIWLPAGPQVIETCAVSIGQQPSIGEEIIQLQPTLKEIQIQGIPPALLPGNRVLQLDGQSYPVTENGTITDVEQLSQIQQSSSYKSWQQNAASSELRGKYALKETTTVNTVPPAALYNIQGNDACLSDGKTGHQVQILSSQLGNTIIQFQNTENTPEKALISPQDPPACR